MDGRDGLGFQSFPALAQDLRLQRERDGRFQQRIARSASRTALAAASTSDFVRDRSRSLKLIWM
ncbi:hypothetical protein ASF41_19810 [Methylobacterium sp. Leaf111]|nr:hypothetical protein ASF41_19810 [Methylobacterium sp. Leaf111]